MRSKAQHKRSYAGFVGAQGGAPVAPANTVAPSITGTAQVGQTLTAANGTWTGREAPSLVRAWKANGVAIPGATAATYVPVVGDVGKTITVTVTATNWKGSASATSAATAAVIAA
ncbi:hypothetical protein WHT83_14950 [Aminobacter sp. P9b]|uniref:hypothetical protein n=1 Tax=Aminobacter sp. P9b TaxID=3133697 RepID=UPI003243967B